MANSSGPTVVFVLNSPILPIIQHRQVLHRIEPDILPTAKDLDSVIVRLSASCPCIERQKNVGLPEVALTDKSTQRG